MKYDLTTGDLPYRYLVTVDEYEDYKLFKIEIFYDGAKFPNVAQSKVEMIMNDREFDKLKEIINQY